MAEMGSCTWQSYGNKRIMYTFYKEQKELKNAHRRNKKDASLKVKFLKVSFHDITLKLW